MNNLKNRRGRTPEGAPNPIDVFVGAKIRFFRERAKMSQETLSGMLGISFQQLQKYEQGKNRVSASRLWDLSQILRAGIDEFFDGMDNDVAQKSPRNIGISNSAEEYVVDDPMNRPEAQMLVNAYQNIKNRNFAKTYLKLMITLSKSSATSSQNLFWDRQESM